jgi:hypothetical protein
MAVTAQARWSRKKKRQGKCTRCGLPRNRYRQLCDRHQKAFTAYMKAYRKRLAQPKESNDNPGASQTGN